MKKNFTYVDRPEILGVCAKDIAASNDLALDVEGSSLYTYKDQVCLIQIATATQVYIIDPLKLENLDLLLKAFQSKRLICHGADYDLRMLNKQYGYVHDNLIFDTKLAADLLGIEGASLAALLKKYFDKVIEKGDQKSDWRKRPLTEQQLDYAANDVVDLCQLCMLMEKELQEKGRIDWHAEWCCKILNHVTKNVEKKDEWRIKGAGVLSRAELNYLKFLWQWRDQEASAQNRPSFKVISNIFLNNFSKIAAQHKGKIVSGEFVIPKNIHKKYHAGLQEVLQKASKVPSKEWPSRSVGEKSRVTYDKELFAHLKNLIAKKAKALDIRPSLILTNADLTQLLLDLKSQDLQCLLDESFLMTWQKNLLSAIWSDVKLDKFKK